MKSLFIALMLAALFDYCILIHVYTDDTILIHVYTDDDI